MRVRLKVLSPICPITCHCPECSKIIASGEAAIQLIDLDAEIPDTEIQLLKAEKTVSCCGKIRTVPEVFPSAREALDMIDTIEQGAEEGEDAFVEACPACLYVPNV